MADHEWVVVAYFSGLTLAAWLMPQPPARRRQATALATLVVMTVFGLAATGVYLLRAWIPLVYLLAGYWLPALLVTSAREEHFEAWLARTDTTLRRWLPSIPAPLVPLVELAYLFCYPLVPLSFIVVWRWGTDTDVERFWLAVLLSGYACYISLPWLLSRPPRMRGHGGIAQGGIRRVNARVLKGWSHQFNTFPSGHVAVAMSAAAGVGWVSSQAGVVVAAVAGAIAVGAAAGGYHYVIDVILGLTVAVIAVAVAGVL